MGGFERRAADPAFPSSVRLLGRRRPLIVPRDMPYRDRRAILRVLTGAIGKLEAEAKAGLLTAADRRYLGALKRFQFGKGRSGAWWGSFIVGLKDARASQDAEYWAGCLVHDGVHAFVQSRGRPCYDEVGPCEAQLDYLIRVGARPDHIASVARFRDSLVLQRARLREPA